jgi:hypothetical protein
MTTMQIYLFTRLDTINNISIFFMVIGIITVIVFSIAWLIAYVKFQDDPNMSESTNLYNRKEWQGWLNLWAKLTKRFIPFAIVTIFLCIIIPNENEAAAIYLIPKISNNQDIQKIPNDAAKIIRLKLDQWISEMDPPIQKENK